MEYVIKRDGSQVYYDKEKIYNAIAQADAECEMSGQSYLGYDLICDAVEDIDARCQAHESDINVEEIQNIVERVLMSYEPDVARAYIRYRYMKEVAREYKADFFEAIGEKLAAKNVANQNANVDEHSFGGRVGEASDTMMKEYALNFCMSKMARENHLNNQIYIHDLSAYAVGMHNCLTVPFDHLLEKGFNTRQVDIRPANSVDTAFQLVAVIFQLQSLMQFGGVSASHIDWTMVPYVRKSFTKHFKDGLKYCERLSDYKCERFFKWLKFKEARPNGLLTFEDEEWLSRIHPNAWEYAMAMTEKEIAQAAEGLYHNLNSLQSRSGNQLPFTSLNYGTCTLPEGRMVIKALLEGSIKGVGKHHRTPIFPCGIFQVGEGINKHKGDPNYDLFQLALKSTSLRLYPNYANIDWSGNSGYDKNDPKTYFSTMGCRTANGWDINGLKQQKDGRGNICPVTIIMPTLAMMATEAASEEYDATGEANVVENFMALLDTKIHEAKDMLIERFEYICRQSPESAKFMYENGLMAGYIPKEGIRSALKHGTIVIGQLGLAETLEILIGCNHTSPKGMELAKRIEQLFKTRCAEFKEKYKLNFGVYYTPKNSWVA